MSLVYGAALDPTRFFSRGLPKARASSFDLTIGRIIDDQGQEVNGPFSLKPGEMVQVVSEEIFKVPHNATGHVTYKTDLTKLGIWALTVGIVDPGWTGPVATTLLNFSKVEYAISKGAPFLRVSFFEHGEIDQELLPKKVDLSAYFLDIQEKALTRFPKTFLNQEGIAVSAGDRILKRIRDEALVWIAAVAILFTLIQFGTVAFDRGSVFPPTNEIEILKEKTKQLDSRIAKLEAARKLQAGMAAPAGSPK